MTLLEETDKAAAAAAEDFDGDVMRGSIEQCSELPATTGPLSSVQNDQ